MDVRAKQLLCLGVVLFPLACVAAVSPHVISTVVRSVIKFDRFSQIEKNEKIKITNANIR